MSTRRAAGLSPITRSSARSRSARRKARTRLRRSLEGGPYKIARLYGNKGDFYTRATKEGQDEFLKPLIDAKKVEVVCEDYVPNWNPSDAQHIMEQCLTKTNGDFSAIVASNDGTAEGALAALVSQGLAGKIKILGGQDANVTTLQNILLGLQHGTVLKTYPLLADSAARLAVDAIKGQKPEDGHINGEFDNGFAKIPTAFIDVEMIDKSNVGDVVKAGVWTLEGHLHRASRQDRHLQAARGRVIQAGVGAEFA